MLEKVLPCPRYENFDWGAEWPEEDEYNQLSTEVKNRITKEDEDLIRHQGRNTLIRL